MKNKEYLTEENSCLVILTYYLNERLCRHCKFPNERPFPGLRKGWRGVGGGVGRSLSFSAVERGAHSKGALIQAGTIFQIITVCPQAFECITIPLTDSLAVLCIASLDCFCYCCYCYCCCKQRNFQDKTNVRSSSDSLIQKTAVSEKNSKDIIISSLQFRSKCIVTQTFFVVLTKLYNVPNNQSDIYLFIR